MAWHDELTEWQQRFCEGFTATANATEEAWSAGYSKPHPQGAENLQKPTVARALEALLQEETAAVIADREHRLPSCTGPSRVLGRCPKAKSV